MQIEVPLSHKLQDIAYEQQNHFELKKDDPSQRNYKEHLSLPSLPHIKPKYQENLIQGKIHNKQNNNNDLLYSNIDKVNLQSVL